VSEKSSTVTVTIEDANIVSYLVWRGFIAIPFVQTEKGGDGKERNTSRVAWDVDSEDGKVEQAVRDYYNNDKVPIHDFIRVLKDVRSGLYNCKQMSGQLKRSY